MALVFPQSPPQSHVPLSQPRHRGSCKPLLNIPRTVKRHTSYVWFPSGRGKLSNNISSTLSSKCAI